MLPISYYDDAVRSALLKAAGNLKWVQFLSVGVNRLIGDCLQTRVQVTTAGPSMAPAMADHTLALMLGFSRGLATSYRNQAECRWDDHHRDSLFGWSKKTVVIYGYGAVGREIAKRVRAFDMHVIGVRRSPAIDDYAHEVVSNSRIDEVIPVADVVVVTAPLDEITRGFFDERRLALFKRTSLLVNVSRGGLIDSLALARALVARTIGGAAIDVTDPEPLGPDHPLWKAPNLLITPHMSAAGSDVEVASFAIENLKQFRLDNQLRSQVA